MPGSGRTTSAWMDGVSLIPADGPLVGDTQADVCVIGAGVAGLTTAYLLAREGRSVLVVDDGPPGMGESLRTTAHLTAAIDDRIFALERRFGARKARLAVESQVAAIDRIERICLDERLDGVFRRVDGWLFLNPDDTLDTLRRELEAAHRAGLGDVRLEAGAPLPFPTGPALLFPRQGEVDAGQYLAGLADAIRRMGGRIHGATHATEIEDGPPAIVRTAKGRIECESIVVCTNTPVFGKVPIQTKQEPNRTYVAAYEVPRGMVPRALYWTTGLPYHYVRLADRAEPGRELLIVGGEDHRTGDGSPEVSMHRLEEWVKARFGLDSPLHRWSGQVQEPADTLPFLGRYPGHARHVYVISGDSGQGFTNHTCGAMLVTDLIQGRRNPWEALYRPNRQTAGGLVERLRANAKGVALLAQGKATGGDAAGERDIPPGAGAILVRDGRKVACYREPSGELRECAAECTHMGAIVQWNDLEKTWDCPWHGSRFTAAGQVVAGPANKALDPIGPGASPARGAARERKADPMATKTASKASRARAGRTRGGQARGATAGKGAPRGRGSPDAIALLKEDHRSVKRLFRRLGEAEGGERESLVDEVERELLVHARLEEELFYPRFKQAVEDREERRLFFEAHEEHEVAERVLLELSGTDPGAEEHAAKAKVLRDLVEHHVREEEGQLFPAARRAIGRDDLLALAEDMRQRRQELLGQDTRSLYRLQDSGLNESVPSARRGERGGAWQRMRRHDE